MSFKLKNPALGMSTKNTTTTKSNAFTGQALGMSNEHNAPTSYKSSPNQMSASPNKGFFSRLKKIGGNFIRGKGAFGLLNPLGAIGSRMGLFGRRRGGGGGGIFGAARSRMAGMRRNMAGMQARMNAMGKGQVGPPGMNMPGQAMMARQMATMQATNAANAPLSYKPKMHNPYAPKKK